MATEQGESVRMITMVMVMEVADVVVVVLRLMREAAGPSFRQEWRSYFRMRDGGLVVVTVVLSGGR